MIEAPELTRQEIVTIGMAVEEFRDEYSGDHIAANRELAERVTRILRWTVGNRFRLVPLDPKDNR